MNKILLWVLIGLGVLGVVAAAVIGVESYMAMHMTVKKPAIYLYPEHEATISVQVDINGKMVADIPQYNDGWYVQATKAGVIDKQYDYLFYEAKLKHIEMPEEGWIIPYNQLPEWFDTNLKAMGLNKKEITQFKEYWLKELPKANYYEIKLLSEEFLEQNMDLIITPEPETIIRTNFVFTPIKEAHPITNPDIITPARDGFVVVEWGGILST